MRRKHQHQVSHFYIFKEKNIIEAAPEITVEAPAEETAPEIVVEAPADEAAPEITVEAPTKETVAADAAAAAPAEEKNAGLAGLIQFINFKHKFISKPLSSKSDEDQLWIKIKKDS